MLLAGLRRPPGGVMGGRAMSKTKVEAPLAKSEPSPELAPGSLL